ncbi:hypothetical protein [Streptomyces tsukubensis]|uniref:hypothetical protein n=1 Tax=Streptomyces tsukubensis TaxID=83656 RepID=UPI00344BB0EC
MASTEAGEWSGGAERETRFVASSATSAEGSDTPEPAEPAGGLRNRTLIACASMGVGARLCFVLSAGVSGGQGTVSRTAAPEIPSLLEQIRITEVKAAALPEAYDAERGLTATPTAADQVAELQNDYWHLAPSVAADDGRLDTALSHSRLRNLTPSVHQADLGSCCLLASGKLTSGLLSDGPAATETQADALVQKLEDDLGDAKIKLAAQHAALLAQLPGLEIERLNRDGVTGGRFRSVSPAARRRPGPSRNSRRCSTRATASSTTSPGHSLSSCRGGGLRPEPQRVPGRRTCLLIWTSM